MPGKRRERPTFAEIVADVRSAPKRPRVPHLPQGDALRTGQLIFQGRAWHKHAADLDLGTTLVLLGTAAVVVLVEGGRVNSQPIDDRTAMARLLVRRFDGPGGQVVGPPWPEEPTYTAHEFRDQDDRTMLYIQRDC